MRSPRKPAIFTSVPPPNYVPGVGRGASGFTTRTDIGPAAAGVHVGTPAGKATEDAGGSGAAAANDGTFDRANGNDGGMLAADKGYDDEDDREADAVWAAIDEKMADRRREAREKRLKADIEASRAQNPQISSQFADLKRRLKDVKEDEWSAIPDLSDTIAKRQRKHEGSFAMPDTVLSRALASTATATHVDPSNAPVPGQGGGLAADGSITDLAAVGEGRQTVLGMKLQKLSDGVGGQTTVDPKGYLTSLAGMRISSDAEVGDIKKARLLLKSVINTNPAHAPGWIAAARLEELAGKMSEARRLALTGTEKCPRAEDVWLEAARVHQPDTAKAILARGVEANPDAIPLWLAAADLETDAQSKQRVLRRALTQIPTSVKLWKAAVDLSNEEDARILLTRACECVPQHAELWLALARLETYENARGVLNRARAAIPTDPSIWIAACKLEESNGNAKLCPKIVARAIKSLAASGTSVDRETWLREAERCETGGAPVTCRAIVFATLGMGVDDIDRQRTWAADAQDALSRGCPETARSMLLKAIETFPSKQELWRQLVKLEKACGTASEEVIAILMKAVNHCPGAIVLWLMAAKERWIGGGSGPPSAEAVAGARSILQEAYRHNPDSEEIILAAHKVELESGEHERARILIARARERNGLCSANGLSKPAADGGTERVYIKSALAERAEGHEDAELALLTEGLAKFSRSWKMWLMKAQALLRGSNGTAMAKADPDGDVAMVTSAQTRYERARAVLQQGTQHCPSSIPLWLAAADLEFSNGYAAKGRAMLEQARLKNPKQDRLWYHAVQIERKLHHADGGSSDAHTAEKLMAQALQECPESGLLWSAHIAMAPRQVRKSRCADALKRCDKDARVVCAVARLFWADGKIDKARSWLKRAVDLAPDDGDAWALLYRFEKAQAAKARSTNGAGDAVAGVVEACHKASPKHGDAWQRVAKDPALWEWDPAWKGRSTDERIERLLELVADVIAQDDVS